MAYKSIFSGGTFAAPTMPTKISPLAVAFTPGQYAKVNAQIAAKQPKPIKPPIQNVPPAPKGLGRVLTDIGHAGKAVGGAGESLVKGTVNLAAQGGRAVGGTVNTSTQAALHGDNSVQAKNAMAARNRAEAQFLPTFTRPVVQIASTLAHPFTQNTSATPKGSEQTRILGTKPIQNIQKGVASTYQKGRSQGENPLIAAGRGVAYGAGQVAQDVGDVAGLREGALDSTVKTASKVAKVVKTATGKDAGVNDLIANTRAQNLSQALNKARGSAPPPRSAFDKHIVPETATGAAVAPEAEKVAQVVKTPKVALNEAGGVPLGQVQDMIDKHQAVTKATGNVADDFAKTQGRTADIKLDVAKSLKERAPLSNSDKQTLQDFRDAKAAGLTPKPLPERLQEADANITALNKSAQTADAEKARLSGQPELAAKIEARNPETYTHRIAQGKGSNLELTARGDTKNPLSVGSLSKTTAGSKKQTFLNATDEEGNRRTVAVKDGKVTALAEDGKTKEDLGNLNLKTNADRMQKELAPTQNKIDALEKEQKILSSTKSRSLAASKRLANIKTNLQEAYRDHANISNKYDLNDLQDKTLIGKDGKKYKLGQATQSEITKNTGQKYYVDPELTSHLNYADSKVALENTRFVEGTKSVLEDKNLAYKEGETAPKGFKSTSNPYFRGYKMQPKLAEVLDDISGSKSGVTGSAANWVGHFLRQLIVYLPIKHDFNEGAGYFIDRGLSKWVNPVANVRMVKSLVKATGEVVHQGPLYRQMLRDGATLMSNDDSELGKVAAKQIKAISGNEAKIAQFAKSFGMSPVRAAKAFQKVSVWDVQDILNIARVDERMKGTVFTKGMNFHDALKATEKTNFQYKMPSRIALPGKAGRAAKEILGSDKVYFGNYTYDKYRIAKNIVKGTANVKHPVQALRSADQLAAAAFVALTAWPLVDKGVQAISGDKNAHVTAPGIAAIPELAKKVIDHVESPTAAIGSQVSISTLYDVAAQLKVNRDEFTGKSIWDVNATSAQKGKQLTQWLKTQAAPAQKLSTTKNATTNKTLSTALGLAGVSLPKNNPSTTKLESLQYDSLPGIQTKARSQASTGDLSSAMNTIKQYDAQVLTAAKADLKAENKQIPPDATLIKQLKKSGSYYAPKQKTIQSWAKPVKAKKGAFVP